MARARNIKPSFFDNDELAELEPLARIIFIGMWTIADYKGEFEWREKRVKAQLLPYDNCDIRKLAINLEHSGFIRFYSGHDGIYVHVVNFSKHQNPHKNEKQKGSEIPALGSEGTQVIDFKGLTINRDKNGTAPDKNETAPADSLFLIPDSLFLIPDSLPPENLAPENSKPENFRHENPKPETSDTAPAEAARSDTAPAEAARSDTAPAEAARSDTAPPPVKQIFDYWCLVMGKTVGASKLTPKRRKAILGRLKDGYSADQIMHAIDRCRLDPFSMGQNDRHTPFNDIELICRSGEKLEFFTGLTEPSVTMTQNFGFKGVQRQSKDMQTRDIPLQEMLEDDSWAN